MSCKPLSTTSQKPLVSFPCHPRRPGCVPWPNGVGTPGAQGRDGLSREVL
jgi:hypothetical protein